MHKIPKYFRKPNTQEDEYVLSSTKQILIPEELDKIKNKIKIEILTTEIRIK